MNLQITLATLIWAVTANSENHLVAHYSRALRLKERRQRRDTGNQYWSNAGQYHHPGQPAWPGQTSLLDIYIYAPAKHTIKLAGESVHFDCELTGGYSATWSRENGERFSPFTETKKLINRNIYRIDIENLDASDSGKYVCAANTGNPNDRESVYLEVRGHRQIQPVGVYKTPFHPRQPIQPLPNIPYPPYIPHIISPYSPEWQMPLQPIPSRVPYHPFPSNEDSQIPDSRYPSPVKESTEIEKQRLDIHQQRLEQERQREHEEKQRELEERERQRELEERERQREELERQQAEREQQERQREQEELYREKEQWPAPIDEEQQERYEEEEQRRQQNVQYETDQPYDVAETYTGSELYFTDEVEVGVEPAEEQSTEDGVVLEPDHPYYQPDDRANTDQGFFTEAQQGRGEEETEAAFQGSNGEAMYSDYVYDYMMD